MGKKYYHISPPNPNDLDDKIREVFTTFGREDKIDLYTKSKAEILLDLKTQNYRKELHTIKKKNGGYEDTVEYTLMGKEQITVKTFSSDFGLLDFLINR